ncbi:hypothetical protein [Paragemmobacter ruber]|uniref:Uncharacterized protein n=1 Tax=Paragemmobacter ruber TaxID=1985673 RepID=A0ABW9Y4Q8_9RHOB|nr:hypothetical protein [Rhodobacter ruber]NBE06892.1 hypothetical protein [Rhodobacter ruber]
MPNAQSVIEAAATLTFLLCWSGVALIFLSMIIPLVRQRAFWKTLVLPFAERSRLQGELIHALLQVIGKSRLNRIGQRLGAAGLTLGLFTGIAWLALRITQGPAP